MEGIGQRLREAREARSLRMEDLQDALNIRARYLEALEADDFNVLPGDVYARGFIRLYAEHVGLDASKLIRDFNVIRGSAGSQEEEATPPRSATRKRSTTVNRSGLASQVAIGAGVLIVLVIAYVVLSHSMSSSKMSVPANSTAPTKVAQASPSAGKSKPTTHPAPSKPAQNTPRPAPTPQVSLTHQTNNENDYVLTGVDNIVVTVKPVGGDCWVQVTTDGQMTVPSLYIHQGQTVSWTSNQSMKLYVGNSSVLSLTAAGQSVQPVPVDGPYTYVFDRKA